MRKTSLKLAYSCYYTSRALASSATLKYPKLFSKNYQNLLEESKDYKNFWHNQAKSRLVFQKEYSNSKICEVDFNSAEFKWFSDGQLNVKENCVDRHVNSTTPALIWERNEPNDYMTISYKMLQDLVHNIAYKLRELGVKKNDKVAIYMPTNPNSVAVMLACAQLGAAHNVVFAGFSANALAERIRDSECKVLVTSDTLNRGKKNI